MNVLSRDKQIEIIACSARPWRGLEIFWTPARQIRIDKGAINTGA